MKALLLVLASVQSVIGVLLWLAPGFFFDAIGPYVGNRRRATSRAVEPPSPKYVPGP